ncbi:MAG: M24 family metallopeptidase [Gemmataceae bacterium]
MTNHLSRRDRLRSKLNEAKIDALLVSYSTNVQYLCGFTGGASYLIVGRSGDMLVSDGRFTEQIADEAPGVPLHIRTTKETTLEALGTVIEKMGLRNVGFESARLTVADFESLKEKLKSVNWAPTQSLVESQRAVKDESELAILRRAIVVAENVYEQFRAELRPEDTELELADRVEALARKLGGRGTSFETIAAVEDRSALAHAPPTTRTAGSGGWLLLDWGAIVDGYRSDLTRLLIWRKPPVPSAGAGDRLQKAYAAVLAARDAALTKMRPGVACKEVDAAARAALEKFGLADKFTHGLGHGLGLETHEKPGLRANSEEVLASGMVVTIEPGVYEAGWGGVRIEDDILITPDGPEFMSHLAYDFESAFI